MALLSLDELLAPRTADQIKAMLLAALNAEGFQVSDWESGGVARTLIEMESSALDDLIGQLIPTITSGGFVLEATGDWLTLLAHELYELDRVAAVFAVQNITLTLFPGTGPYTITAGQLIALSASGKRYINTGTGTVTDVLPLTIAFKAESPGSGYNDAASTITKLVTPLPGLAINNVAPDYTGVTHIGASSGSVTPSKTGAIAAHTVVVTIATSGQVTAGSFSFVLDGASPTTVTPIPATYNIGATNMRLNFANGAGTPSFLVGDTFSFSSPGSPIAVQGVDEESDDALRARCLARWPALSDVPTDSKYYLWAVTAAPGAVTKVSISADMTFPGQVDVLIAGPAGAVGADVRNAVQAYIDARVGILETAVVDSASNVTVSAAGTVTVNAADLATVQTQAQASWNVYVQAAPIGGVIRLAELAQALMDAGAVDYSGLQLNAVAANVALTSGEVAVVSGALASTMTWVVV